MTIYQIDPTPDTVHTFFSRELTPILTIVPGDTVRFQTLDAGSGLEAPHADGTPRQKLIPTRQGMGGHALCGPIAIRGAEPGMMLAVQIERIQTGAWGWTFGSDELDDSKETMHIWSLNGETMTASNQLGHKVKIRPFMGVMGMPPPEPGQHSTIPPRIWGGNIDCKELVSGSTLYLPIPVSDGLFSTGDGHAAQGDGELSGTAIECPMEEVVLTFDLIEQDIIKTPYAYTPAGWITFGFRDNFEQATRMARGTMLDWMSARFQIPRVEAIALASSIVDFRITQMVNGQLGVHALISYEAIAQLNE